MDQFNAAGESRIYDAIDVLSEGLYKLIAVAVQNFDVPTRTLQGKVNAMRLLLSRSPYNKVLLET